MRLTAAHICHRFVRGSIVRECLADININVLPGEFHCIMGESGSGKSTFLNILTGMLKPDAGTVCWAEHSIYERLSEAGRTNYRSGDIGYLMQGMTLLGNLTVWENLICPLELAGRVCRKEQAEKILRDLELWDYRFAYPAELSGGEYRRISLARILLMEPKILIADEPTSSLDDRSAGIIRQKLTDYCMAGYSVVVATHDSQFIREGRIVHQF